MRALDRKLLRNLGSMKGQVIAIVLIIACGVASFVTVLTAYRGLRASRAAYYSRYRMADVFASVKRAPRSVLRELERVPGVRHVEGRIVFEVTIDLPELPQPCTGRALSLPDHRQRILNDLHLVEGDWFTGDGTREVIVSDKFARIHHLQVGDELRVLMNNKKQALRIVATALSPEFVYMIQGAGDILPDPEHFTVLWMSETFAEAVFDFEDATNDIVASLGRGAQPEEVIDIFDDLLDRYGALGAYAQKDQASDRYLSAEIQGLKASATLTPSIFLAVAAFVLNMLMRRLVRTQRTQVAVFRAFGYSTRDLAFHYLGLALLVGLIGGAVGVGLGLYFARYVLESYREFFSFPVLEFGIDPVAVPLGFAISLGFAALGALGAVREAARLDPAEGMRPEAPRAFQRSLAERLPFLWRRLGFTTRMIVRRLSRAKWRAAATVVGVSLSVSILLLTFFSYDAMFTLMDSQFRLVERQDVHVTFHDERSRAALYEVRRLEGVRHAEPELVVPVKFVHGWRERQTALIGLQPRHDLYGLLDTEKREIPLPEEGVLLCDKLADLLGVGVGDDVEVRVLTGRKPVFHVPVTSVVAEYMGVNAYADLYTLSRWIGEAGAVSGVRLLVDPEREDALGAELKQLPAVAGVSVKSETQRVFQDTIAESQNIMLGTLLLFAGAIIFGVLYNAARIALAERHRELGALRVLGFTHREVSILLSSENLLLAALALAPGLALGSLFSWLLCKAYETDLYRFPFVLTAHSMFRTVLVTLVFAVLASLAVLRRLRRLDLVEVLKDRE